MNNKNLDYLGYTTAVNTVAVAIADGLTDDELALYAAVFTQIGDTLATIPVLRVAGNAGNEED